MNRPNGYLFLVGPELGLLEVQELRRKFPTSYLFLGSPAEVEDTLQLPRDDGILLPLLKRQFGHVVVIGYTTLDCTIRRYLTKAKRGNNLVVHINPAEEYGQYVRKGETWYDHPLPLALKRLQ